MSFSRQLAFILFAAVLVALTAREVLFVQEVQGYVERQLESHARDSARSLGLSISLHLAEGDELFAESIVDAMFDSGDYEAIRVLDADGNALIERARASRSVDVPEWFANLVPVRAPEAEAELARGWQRTGRVVVRSYPGYATEQLWQSTLNSARSAVVFLLLALVLVSVLLRFMLRPLGLIERQARAVAEREFPRIEKLPRTREFRRVAEAMNLMTGSVEKIITEQSEQARRLQAEAYRDPVTGLRNRRALGMDIEQLARDASQHGPGAFILLNVRGLDAINQGGGYEKGDAFMRAVGDVVAQRVDGLPSAVGRWGGAIFAVVLREASREGVIELAQQVIADIEQLSLDGDRVESVNVGVVFHSGADDAETLADKCETALRNAEGEGPNTWHLWQASETVAPDALRDEASWEVRLKRIVAEGDVVLESQPVNGVDGSEMHREVLARFRDDDGELVPAGRFIPVAVRLGLGSSLDVVILEQVLGVLATRFQSTDRLAVNLSASAAGDEDFRRWLRNRLGREPRARCERLCVEVPEHFAANDPDGIRALVESVRPLGVRVGVDHCGSGDASLAALRGLPLDYAKLYGGFVKGIDGDRERQALLRSFVSIGHGMGIAMVAEFVETEAELGAVKDLGFDAVQGYLVGRPTALD